MRPQWCSTFVLLLKGFSLSEEELSLVLKSLPRACYGCSCRPSATLTSMLKIHQHLMLHCRVTQSFLSQNSIVTVEWKVDIFFFNGTNVECLSLPCFRKRRRRKELEKVVPLRAADYIIYIQESTSYILSSNADSVIYVMPSKKLSWTLAVLSTLQILQGLLQDVASVNIIKALISVPS